MWVMVDVVGNHMGYGAPSAEFAPLSDPSNYHDCNACPQYCNIDDFGDQNQVELCRLVGLPDLNQTNPYVSNVLTTWIHDLVAIAVEITEPKVDANIHHKDEVD